MANTWQNTSKRERQWIIQFPIMLSQILPRKMKNVQSPFFKHKHSEQLIFAQATLTQTKPLNSNLLKSITVLFSFLSYPADSAIFWVLHDSTWTVLNITFDMITVLHIHFTFFFASNSLNLRDSRRPFCSKSSIFLDFNLSCGSKYTGFPPKLLI